MREKVINYCMNSIKNNKKYDDESLAIIKYGLEGIYLTISKMIILIIAAILLNILKEFIIFMLIYNIIRMPSFGLHATKSSICLISSLIIFIGCPLICLNIKIPIIIKTIIGLIAIILMYKYSPADTKKRPIVNKNRRTIYKILSVIITTLFIIMSQILGHSYTANSLIFTVIIQTIIILPITYKIFKLPYNNYLTYSQNMV